MNSDFEVPVHIALKFNGFNVLSDRLFNIFFRAVKPGCVKIIFFMPFTFIKNFAFPGIINPPGIVSTYFHNYYSVSS